MTEVFPSKKIGATSLMYACQQGKETQVINIVNSKPSSVLERERTLKTALHYCAESGDGGVSSAAVLLDAAPTLVVAQDQDGYSALHLAVIAGNLSLGKLLIARGAPVNMPDNEGHTPVHWATVCGEIECLELLLSKGGDPSLGDMHGGCPLHYAAQMCGPSSEMPADRRLGMAALRILLESRANPNLPDNHGRQPILWAASAGSSEAILVLVSAGANVAAADKDGLTALHCAASRGHTDCVETLINLCNTEPDVIDNNGCSALFYAVTLGHADATQTLINHGADTNRQDRKGRTAVHCGAAKGQLETLKVVAAWGGNLWLKTVRGDYPLHDAVASGRRPVVLWLLSQRPDSVNSPNNDGRCPLHIASLHNNIEMCKTLLDAGSLVNPVMRTSRGALATPLDAALHKNHRGCAKYLQLHGGVPASRLNSESAAIRGLSSNRGETVRVGLIDIKEKIEANDKFEFEPKSESKPIVPPVVNSAHVSAERNKSQGSVRPHILQVYVEDDLMIRRLRPHEGSDSSIEERIRRRRRKRKSKIMAEREKSAPARMSLKGASSSDETLGIPCSISKPELTNELHNSFKAEKIVQTEFSLKPNSPRDRLENVLINSIEDNIENGQAACESKTQHVSSCDSEEKSGVRVVEVEVHKEQKSEESNEFSGSLQDTIEETPQLPIVSTGTAFNRLVEKTKEVAEKSKLVNQMVSLLEKGSSENGSNKLTSVNEDTTVSLPVVNALSTSDDKAGLSVENETKTQTQIMFEQDGDGGCNSLDGIEQEDINKEDCQLIEQQHVVNSDEQDVMLETTTTAIVDGREPQGNNIMNEQSEEIDTDLNSLPKSVPDVTSYVPNDNLVAEVLLQSMLEDNGSLKRAKLQSDDATKVMEETDIFSDTEQNENNLTLENEPEPPENNSEGECILEQADHSYDVNGDVKMSGTHDFPECSDIENIDGKAENTESISHADELNKTEQFDGDNAVESESEKNKNVFEGSQDMEQSLEELAFNVTKDSDDAPAETGLPEPVLPNDEVDLLAQMTTDNAPGSGNKALIKVLGDPTGGSTYAAEKRRKLRRKREGNKKWMNSVSSESFEVLKLPDEKTDDEAITDLDENQDAMNNEQGSVKEKVKRFHSAGKVKISRICRRNHKSETESAVLSTVSVTQAVQYSVRKYHLERRIFHQLLELKRLQIRAGRASEAVLVKRLVDDYKRAGLILGLQQYEGAYTFRTFEKFLYEQLRLLQATERRIIPRLSSSDDLERLTAALRKSRVGQDILATVPNNPALCTQQTHRCHHATHAYTGIPCAAYIAKPNHHTMAKPGHNTGFLPKLVMDENQGEVAKTLRHVDPTRPLTLQLSHGPNKQQVTQPRNG